MWPFNFWKQFLTRDYFFGRLLGILSSHEDVVVSMGMSGTDIGVMVASCWVRASRVCGCSKNETDPAEVDGACASSGRKVLSEEAEVCASSMGCRGAVSWKGGKKVWVGVE